MNVSCLIKKTYTEVLFSIIRAIFKTSLEATTEVTKFGSSCISQAFTERQATLPYWQLYNRLVSVSVSVLFFSLVMSRVCIIFFFAPMIWVVTCYVTATWFSFFKNHGLKRFLCILKKMFFKRLLNLKATTFMPNKTKTHRKEMWKQ